MLADQESLPATEEKSVALENSKKKPKESIADTFPATEEGFNDYCKKTAKSKLEYEKAKSRWPESMKAFKNRTEFLEFVTSIKPAKQTKSKETDASESKSGDSSSEESKPTGTEEEFYNYVKHTAISKITKTEIRNKFGNLPDSITLLNKTGADFKNALKELKDDLKDE